MLLTSFLRWSGKKAFCDKQTSYFLFFYNSHGLKSTTKVDLYRDTPTVTLSNIGEIKDNKNRLCKTSDSLSGKCYQVSREREICQFFLPGGQKRKKNRENRNKRNCRFTILAYIKCNLLQSNYHTAKGKTG